MASTNFDMDSDESYHSESEFYYPEEMENYNDKENIGLQHEENLQNAQFTMARVQKYILSQRPENTVKKKQSTTCTFGKDSFLRWAKPEKLRTYLRTS